MIKTNLKRFVVILIALITLVGSMTADASTYTTYTYDVYGNIAQSPAAYVYLDTISGASIADSILKANVNDASLKYTAETFGQLNTPKDIVVDDLMHLYIADAGNNRIVCLDEKYNLRLLISKFTNNQGVPDSLKEPRGVFVTEKEVFVADTGNSRVVIFDKLGNFVTIVPQPASEVFPEKSVYTPVSVAVDSAGRIYVVSSTTNYGVISINRDGSFNGFVGPQKVTYNLFQYMLRAFQTEEQIAKSVQIIPTEYNNLTIDENNMIYVTTDAIDEGAQQGAISGRSTSSAYAPVKKLNPSGTDVMLRSGFYPPSGEVWVNSAKSAENSVSGASKIVDVALGPSGIWSIIDQKRSKVYTYDQDGNLLYIFGDFGKQRGQISQDSLIGITYQGTNILLLDQSTSMITVYKRTEYGDLIAEAIQSNVDRQYSKAVDYYTEILRSNNNFDSAYVGIAQSYYEDKRYKDAMDIYKYSYDTKNYSEAYKKYRTDWVRENIWTVPLAIVVLCVGYVLFSKYRKKVNLRGIVMKEKRTWLEELLYVYHVMYHPFDGFWDLKHEKRGSPKGATIIFVLTILAFIYKGVGQGYLFNPYYNGIDVVITISSVVLPLMLWVVANWCLTTLFDGEGSFKDVYVTSCYAIMPIFITTIPSVLLTNILTNSEAQIISVLQNFGFIWAGFLLFSGMMVIHDFTIFKNIVMILASVVGMGLIMFIGILFTSLLQKIFFFIYNLYEEMQYNSDQAKTIVLLGILGIIVLIILSVAIKKFVKHREKVSARKKSNIGKPGMEAAQ